MGEINVYINFRLRFLFSGLLLFITLFSLLPWQAQGPFDARDWSSIEGVTVTLPWWQFLIEPISAIGHIIIGAPDFRLAAIAIILWVMLVSWVVHFRSNTGTPIFKRTLWATAVSLFAFWCVPALMLFYSHLHFPGWQLQVDDPQWLVADLQTHTIGSHDALVRAGYNLQWHADRGFNVIGMTEHDYPEGSFYAQQLSEVNNGPLVVPGIEVANEFGSFLLALGVKPEQPLISWKKGEKGPDFSQRFALGVDKQHQGAVISMAWRLKADDIEALVDDGVHAFELINVGHPNIPDTVRNEMLRMEREGRIRLVSSSDWHGWGGSARSWTLLRIPGAEGMNREQQRQAIITLLRDGKSEDVVPVVAGYQGESSWLRTLFTPVVETARYAAELSPLRLMGWWLWALLIWLVMRQLQTAGFAAGRSLWAITLLMVGAVLVWKGIALYQITPEGEVMRSRVTKDLGTMAVQVAVPLLLVGGWILRRVFIQRNKTI